jgi:hypothetical protein
MRSSKRKTPEAGSEEVAEAYLKLLRTMIDTDASGAPTYEVPIFVADAGDMKRSSYYPTVTPLYNFPYPSAPLVASAMDGEGKRTLPIFGASSIPSTIDVGDLTDALQGLTAGEGMSSRRGDLKTPMVAPTTATMGCAATISWQEIARLGSVPVQISVLDPVTLMYRQVRGTVSMPGLTIQVLDDDGNLRLYTIDSRRPSSIAPQTLCRN